MVYLDFNCNMDARRVAARCFHNGIGHPVASEPSAVPKSFDKGGSIAQNSGLNHLPGEFPIWRHYDNLAL